MPTLHHPPHGGLAAPPLVGPPSERDLLAPEHVRAVLAAECACVRSERVARGSRRRAQDR